MYLLILLKNIASICILKNHVFFFQFFFHAEISCLLHICEKLKQNQTVVKKEKKYLIFYLFKFQLKNFHLQHHQQFLKEHDDKLIQESVEVFKEELHVLKKKQNFILFNIHYFCKFCII